MLAFLHCLHFVLNFLILLSLIKTPFAKAEIPTPKKMQHPGFIHCSNAQKANEELGYQNKNALQVLIQNKVNYFTQLPKEKREPIEKEMRATRKRMIDELESCVYAYANGQKDEVSESALKKALNDIFLICNDEKEQLIRDCPQVISSAVKTLDTHWNGNPTVGVNRMKVAAASYFYKTKNYPIALNYYQSAYQEYSQQACSNEHVQILVQIMNTYLQLKDRNSFIKYWNIGQTCQATGKLQPKGLRIVEDKQKNLVIAETEKPQAATPIRSQPPITVPPATASEISYANSNETANDRMNKFRGVPFRDNDDIVGFKILDVEPNSFLAKLGLRKNDIIKNSNGVPINSASGLIQFFQPKNVGTSTVLGYERDGKTEYVKINWK